MWIAFGNNPDPLHSVTESRKILRKNVLGLNKTLQRISLWCDLWKLFNFGRKENEKWLLWFPLCAAACLERNVICNSYSKGECCPTTRLLMTALDEWQPNRLSLKTPRGRETDEYCLR
ncbi:hypothetical protein CEXT_584671 [Caerostris extrusa]|uniref:Uncharacterized protein n=1 Tax=Caerostris extrusa TaxID=172846 RepID=A0AAV4U716_CAEEX|nr:hypothetical protein CEXT_584671 [Caerostris extrusa]